MNQRYYSLDVFRGATVAFMILVNNQAGAAYAPLDHASWHGLTPTDLVFPFFLFAMGNALAFVLPKLEQQGTPTFLRKVGRRTLLIFAIGFLLNWFPFLRWDHNHLVVKGWTWENANGGISGVRVMGVLGRIALCYGCASLIVYFAKFRGAFVISGCLLLLYWALCLLLGDSADPYSLSGWFGTAIDKAVFGAPHLYHGEGVAFDPEGLASTIPAIVSVILGYFAGSYIRLKGTTYEMLAQLFVAAIILLLAGYCWGGLFPINKKIWTSSYVLVAAGWALACLATLIYFIEFRKAQGGWSRLFDVFGKNPLFIFVLSGVVPRLLGLVRIPDDKDGYTSPLGWFYEHCCKPLSAGRAENASLLYALVLVALYWLIAWWLDKRKIYIRV
jgi:predicted acyltransferase